MHEPRVGIFRLAFPAPSEVYIRNQVRHLSRYKPVYVLRDQRDELEFPVVLPRDDFFRLRRRWMLISGSVNEFLRNPQVHRLKVIHAHFGPDAVYAMPLAKRLDVPLVVTFHGFDATTNTRQLLLKGSPPYLRYVLLRERLKREGRMFVAVSDFIRNALIHQGFPPDRVVVHHIGVDTMRLKPIERQSGCRYILNIARHVKVKGVDQLLRAFAEVAPRHPNVFLLQVGSGPLTGQLTALAQSLGIGGQVVFLGVQEYDRIISLLQQAELLVLSSRIAADGAEEALGIVINEASACGIPVVGTRSGGIPETIMDGETGFLVPENDIGDLARKVDHLLANPETRESMGRRGRKFVCEKFDIVRQTARLEEIYDAL